MNTSDPREPQPSGRRHRLLWIVGVVLGLWLLGVVLLVVGVTSCLRLSRDARTLRNALMESAAVPWDKTIELSVGSFTLHLARAGLQFVDLDPDARVALQAARGAEVGVYRLKARQSRLDRAAMLSAADAAMTARCWDRLVGVLTRGELVAVYVPREIPSTRDVKVCLVAWSGQQLVVGSARSDLEPLAQLALKHAHWQSPAEAQFAGAPEDRNGL